MKTATTISLLVLAASLHAQDNSDPKTILGFTNQGSATFGYRFTDVNGYQPKFQELFALGQGPRLLDFSLFGDAKDGKNRYADSYSLTLNGIGGEPYTSAQFTARKSHVYDLRATFRQSHYYWDRNDAAVQPSGLNGLTSNHNWATVRKLGSVNLLVHATKNLRFYGEFYRNTRTGDTFTTRTPDYFGSASSWGSFARANPYYLFAPIDEVSDRATGGVDYTRDHWAAHYRVGYQSFTDSVNGSNLSAPLRSINIDDANTAKELLTSFHWKDSRQLKTPVSEFSYTGRLTSRLEARGGYIFYRYSGPASLDMAFTGTARSPIGPYNVSMLANASVTEPNHVVDQGFTYKVNEWWSTQGDYRYSHFSVDSTGNFMSITGGQALSGDARNQWMIGTHTADLNMVFTPATALLFRAGIRYMNSDVRMLEDGVIDAGRTKHINTVWPVASLSYQPSKMFTIRGDIEQTLNGTSYTRVTPHTDIGGRLIVRYRPIDKFYIEDSMVVRNRKLLATDYTSNIRMNAASATYEFNDRLSLHGGFSYDSFFASNFVNFLRGPAPFTNIILRDQTVSRVWSTGLRVKPLPRLGIDFTGNYVRTTGQGEITGEKPIYGPMKFPYATGSVYYDFPKLGRLTAQLQRTYYIEQIVTGNNFSANLLTIAWTHSF